MRPSPRSSGHDPATTGAVGGAIDFTMMHATHDAFRRDLRLLSQAASNKDAAPLARFHTFRAQLLLHHGVEDDSLWPMVRTAALGRPGAAQALDDMEREHGVLEPLLDAVDEAFAGQPDRLEEALGELETLLTRHLDHEERDVLPLIAAVCVPADWRRFARYVRRRQGLRGAATYVPWILDRLDAAKRRRFLGALPLPVRLVNRLCWERRYRRKHR